MNADANRSPSLLDFGGAPGNLALTFGLPAIVGYLYFAVAFNDGALIPSPAADVDAFWLSLIPTSTAAGVYMAWFGIQAAFQALMPGRVVQGTELPDGRRLRYKMNGPASLAATLAVVAGLHLAGYPALSFIHTNFGALLSSMTLFVFAFSAFLYVYGKRHGQFRGSGNRIHDFFMGTGHNPRIPPDGLFDLKFFCEARPGLIMWMLVDASFMYVQYRTYGFVSLSMMLVCGFQWLYVFDYYAHEPAVLTTMDIKHENFGFMLAFGDLVWVPMTYGLQAMYLIHHVHDLSPWAAAGIIGLNFLGLAIFRTVNNQKNRFRRAPDDTRIWGRKAEYMQTKRGSKLLLSGFWGWSRHFNYVGDELMALAWSLPCGFGALAPYFYPIYFGALLLHRERRDNQLCQEKYGDDWDAYCKRVRWRIVPGVY
jgi:protein-S-isoprenylcysteine O-methyltransferase Ste14